MTNHLLMMQHADDKQQTLKRRRPPRDSERSPRNGGLALCFRSAWGAVFDEERDCFQPDPAHPEASANTDHHNCAVDRIRMFARIVAESSQPKATRVDALKYMVHFLSDLHQRMHAIAEGRGGNGIKIVEFGHPDCHGDRPCNLRGLWDSALIEHAELNEQLYAQHLQVVIARDRLDLVPEGTPRDWANESHVAAEGTLLENGGLADQIYFDHEISVVDRRLSLAGLRPASMLNAVFSGNHSAADAHTDRPVRI